MVRLHRTLFAFMLVKALTYAETEVGLYTFEFNRQFKTNTEKVYIKNQKKYVELQKLLEMLGITNNEWINEEFKLDVNNIYGQEKIINLEKKYIKIGKSKISFIDEIYEKNEKIYVQLDFLKNLLSISEVDIDEDHLNIGIETGFRLPSEMENIRKYRREQFLYIFFPN